MNKSYNIEIVDDVTVVRFIDKPKPDDIRMSIDEIATISLSGLRLWDLSDSGWDLTSEELGEVADYAKTKLLLPSKIAFVAPEDLSYGLSRVYEAFRAQDGLQIEIFRTEEKALNWLKNIPEQNPNTAP
jgi:hypothetical protein